jgi:predicted Rossmann-fold nucleotide-binding protein
MIQMLQLTGVHQLPIVIFNFDNYYDLLLRWFDLVVQEGFGSRSNSAVFSVIDALEGLEPTLASYGFVPAALHDVEDLAPTDIILPVMPKLQVSSAVDRFSTRFSVSVIPV